MNKCFALIKKNNLIIFLAIKKKNASKFAEEHFCNGVNTVIENDNICFHSVSNGNMLYDRAVQNGKM